jgi:hypothetical protein
LYSHVCSGYADQDSAVERSVRSNPVRGICKAYRASFDACYSSINRMISARCSYKDRLKLGQIRKIGGLAGGTRASLVRPIFI